MVIEAYENGSMFAAFEAAGQEPESEGLSSAERAFLKIIAPSEHSAAAA
jgi:hypothetical protein